MRMPVANVCTDMYAAVFSRSAKRVTHRFHANIPPALNAPINAEPIMAAGTLCNWKNSTMPSTENRFRPTRTVMKLKRSNRLAQIGVNSRRMMSGTVPAMNATCTAGRSKP